MQYAIQQGNMIFYLDLFLMLAAAIIMGLGAQRIGMPIVVGQLLAGVVLGPSLLNIVDVYCRSGNRYQATKSQHQTVTNGSRFRRNLPDGSLLLPRASLSF